MNNPIRNNSRVLSTFLAAAMMGANWEEASRPKQDKYTRPCLYCKTPHSGNNAFCSADCCRKWKAEQKQIKYQNIHRKFPIHSDDDIFQGDK
jgi:hypothetical protein